MIFHKMSDFLVFFMKKSNKIKGSSAFLDFRGLPGKTGQTDPRLQKIRSQATKSTGNRSKSNLPAPSASSDWPEILEIN